MNLGPQDTSGVSRDELAAALMEVSEGRIPKDRIALRELTREMLEWPYADISGDSRTAQMASTGGWFNLAGHSATSSGQNAIWICAPVLHA